MHLNELTPRNSSSAKRKGNVHLFFGSTVPYIPDELAHAYSEQFWLFESIGHDPKKKKRFAIDIEETRYN